MKSPRWLVLGTGMLLAPLALAFDRLPIDYFSRQPDTLRARLSPDGRHLAFLRDDDGRTKLHVLEIDTGKIARIDAGRSALANGARKEITSVEWVGDRRVVVSTSVWDAFYGVIALNIDGRMAVPLSGFEDEKLRVSEGPRLHVREILHRFDDEEESILMLDRHQNAPGRKDRPDVLKVSTLDGRWTVELENPGDVTRWGVDSAGQVRLGIVVKGSGWGAIYRDSGKSEWRTILPVAPRGGAMRPVGFDKANDRVLVAGLTPEKRWTLFPLDPATGALGEALLADPEYDVLPERGASIDGMALSAPIFSRTGSRLLGVRYLADALRVQWFERDFAAYQRAADKVLPDTVNIVVDISRDGQRVLWLGYSDQNPGVYLLLDTAKRTFKPVARRMGWVKPELMARTLVVKYEARDGLTIHGFLTVPPGHEPKNLPLVTLPHGGPWARDAWGYDPLVQLLANRGYAVLQMNYRGSPGYGEELYRSARRQIGGKIQDDIEDATRWAIATGVADPKRIAILGASYGGYSALFALGHNPGLYRCGVSLAGVTDWPDIYDDRKDNPAYRNALRHWRQEIGDPDKDAEKLQAISPVSFADKIVEPVLIVQGKDDRVVPAEQARRMIKALEQAGRPPQSAFIAKLGHSLGDEKQRAEIFGQIVAFLEKHLGPGVK